MILHMLRIGATQRYVDPLAAGINDLQEMSKTHEAISKAKTQTWLRILTHYLPLYFPEIERFAGNSRSDWTCNGFVPVTYLIMPPWLRRRAD